MKSTLLSRDLALCGLSLSNGFFGSGNVLNITLRSLLALLDLSKLVNGIKKYT